MQTLLKLLSDGRFHSGEALGNALGVSRSAVWKRLQQLEAEYGLVLQSVRGKGYRLETPLSLIDPARVVSIWPLEIHFAIDSTNAEVLRRISSVPTPFIIVAEQQTAGRGRRGRAWISPFAENLYCTLGITVRSGAKGLEGLSLVVGLAVVRALERIGIQGAGLKWPNDVLLQGKKLAGILLEVTGDPADVCHVAIGVGINVNMRVADQIDQPWTSLIAATGTWIDRNVLLSALCAELAGYLKRHQELGFAASRAEWESMHVWQGRQVTLSTVATSIIGRALGIDEHGALRLDIDGREHSYSGGELSLRLSDDS